MTPEALFTAALQLEAPVEPVLGLDCIYVATVLNERDFFRDCAAN